MTRAIYCDIHSLRLARNSDMCLIPAELCKTSRVFPVGASNSTEKYVLQVGQVENRAVITGLEPNGLSRSVPSYTLVFIFSSKMASYLYYIMYFAT